METIKYTVIKNIDQYNEYCNILEALVQYDNMTSHDEIELLTLLIEKWDSDHNTFNDADPIKMIKSLMDEHDLKAKDMVNILALSKETVSKILNYHKGLSKDTILRLADYFYLSQEAFNRPYELTHEMESDF